MVCLTLQGNYSYSSIDYDLLLNVAESIHIHLHIIDLAQEIIIIGRKEPIFMFNIRCNYNCIIRQIYLSLTGIFGANSVLAWARITKYRKF